MRPVRPSAKRKSAVIQRSTLGEDSRAYVMPRERSIDINDEQDLAFAEFLIGRRA